MAFARAGIELPGDPVAITLSDVLQRRPLRQVLAKEAIEVLVRAPFPRMVRRREVAGHSEAALELFVIVKLGTVVERQGVELLALAPDHACRGRRRLVGGTRRQLANDREA